MKLSVAGATLVALTIAMWVCVLLLTPLSGFETRPLPSIRPIGVFSLVLVFSTAVLNAIAVAVVSRRRRTTAGLSGIGIFLVLPGFIVDQTGLFSPYAPPEAIRILEYVLLFLEAALFVVAIWLYRQTRGAGGSGSEPP